MQKFFSPPSRHLPSQPFPPRFAIVYAASPPPTKKWECSHFCDSRNMINHTPPTPIRHVNINLPTPGENVDINIPNPVFQVEFFRIPPPFFSRGVGGPPLPRRIWGRGGTPRPRGCRPPAGAGGSRGGQPLFRTGFFPPQPPPTNTGGGGRPKPISRGRGDRGKGAGPNWRLSSPTARQGLSYRVGTVPATMAPPAAKTRWKRRPGPRNRHPARGIRRRRRTCAKWGCTHKREGLCDMPGNRPKTAPNN